MSKFSVIVLALLPILFLMGCTAPNNQSITVFNAPFDSSFNTNEWEQAWGIQWSERTSDCEIIEGGYNNEQDALRVFYPENAVGPRMGGAQFPMLFADMPHLKADTLLQAATLKYHVKFEEGFDFRLGGKLPGLMGGKDSWSRSGGIQPDGANGWTLRFMWRTEGHLVVYAYLPISNNGKWGGQEWGQDIDCNFTATPGTWHTIEQFIDVGTPGIDNGQLKVSIDGVERLAINDLCFWYENNEWGKIGGICFSTFHGGNTSEWGPLNNSHAQFAGFEVVKID